MSIEYLDKGCDITIFNEIGDCFTTGIAFGVLWNFFKGFAIGVPKHRLKSGILLLRDRACLTGGFLGAWGTLYQIFYCSFKSYRKQTDILNLLYAGFSVSFVMNIRSSGFRAALESGIWSGCFLLIISGLIQVQLDANKKENLRKNIEYTKKINSNNQLALNEKIN